MSCRSDRQRAKLAKNALERFFAKVTCSRIVPARWNDLERQAGNADDTAVPSGTTARKDIFSECLFRVVPFHVDSYRGESGTIGPTFMPPRVRGAAVFLGGRAGSRFLCPRPTA
jgi:hypothetical protein